MSRIHFIAIGGSIMHNLAIALQKRGHRITGSDDDIFDPARERLSGYGLLPHETGWFPAKITADIDFIILGMHAKAENPELKKAIELGLKIYSYPEFIYRETQHKTRVVIAGSHGKSTITSLVMHVMKYHRKNFDYLVGAGIPGFGDMVRLSEESPVIILEGDEYFSSALDKTPKFITYKHSIGLLSGIAWDHINAFPTKEIYEYQFEKFIRNTPLEGTLVFNGNDPEVRDLVRITHPPCRLIEYNELPFKVENRKFNLVTAGRSVPLRVFGRHNMQNFAGAMKVLECLGISESMFIEAVPSFPGAKNRLETLMETENFTVYRDFAHAPSKVRASVKGVKELDPGRRLVAVLELHTYSSLNPTFLPEYKNTLEPAEEKYIFIDDHALRIKNLPPISDDSVWNSFNDRNIIIVRKPEELKNKIVNLNRNDLNLLFMSSGNLGGLNIQEIFDKNRQP